VPEIDMPLTNTATRYGAVSQAFHWLTVVLVGAAYLLGPGGPESRVYLAARASEVGWHETIGVLVFAVVLARLLWRLIDRPPGDPSMAAWMDWSARAVHWLLYALLVAIPATAIIGAYLEGHPVTFLGLGAIGPFGPLSHDLGLTISDLHRSLGSFIVWVAGAHAAAALFQHFVMRDRVLVSMLPLGERAEPRQRIPA
jgi:cytochrome b561